MKISVCGIKELWTCCIS